MQSLSIVAFVAFSAALPAIAAPNYTPGQSFSATVVSSTSKQTRSGENIYTESVIRTQDGSEYTVQQLGGEVNGLRTIVFDGWPVLQPQDQVDLEVSSNITASGKEVFSIRNIVSIHRPGHSGFERTVTSNSLKELYWKSGCVLIQYNEQESKNIPPAAVTAELDAAVSHWNDSVASCSYMNLQVEEKSSPIRGKFDQENVILFRKNQWTRPADGDMQEVVHPPNAAGITVVTMITQPGHSREGEIVDADIELNEVNFTFSVCNGTDCDPEPNVPCVTDLRGVVAHELGHLLGLEHTCWGGGIRPVNKDGQPIPACSEEPWFPETTMYPEIIGCPDTTKATLHQDDIDGVCSAYPATDDPNQCKAVSFGNEGCCSGSPSPLAPVALLFTGFIFYRRQTSR